MGGGNGDDGLSPTSHLTERHNGDQGGPVEEDDGLYSLPFHGASSVERRTLGTGLCIQGNHGQSTHTGTLAYSLDFRLPEGTTVLASRGGVVAAAVDHFVEGGLAAHHKPRANFVAVQHADGTYARYFHIRHNGCTVKVGDVVHAGQQIAKSGNTGYSSTPHLHFDVVNMLPEDTCQFAVGDPANPNEDPLLIDAVIAAFSGPLPSQGSTVYRLVQARPHDGSTPLTNADDVRGNAVFMKRGGCSFVTKAKHAVESGAACLLVANSNPGPELFSMGGTKQPLPLPAVLVSQESGELIKALVAKRDVELHLEYSDGFLRAMHGNDRFAAVAAVAAAAAETPASSAAPQTPPTVVPAVEGGAAAKPEACKDLLFVAQTQKVWFRDLTGEPFIPRQGVLYPDRYGNGSDIPPPAGCCSVM